MTVDEVIAERGKVYGDAHLGHANIGLAWTALVQQHYGLKLPATIPASLVAQMMVVLKIHRAARVFKDDNYLDARAYTNFAEQFQQLEQPQP